MKIKSLQISNILSFKYYDDIEDAPKITFNNKLSILIGHNGSGKSTVLEIIHFVFGNVLFSDPVREKSYKNTANQKNLLQLRDIQIPIFRLQKNWDFVDKPQKIKIEITFDEKDELNVRNIKDNYSFFKTAIEKYSPFNIPDYTVHDFQKNTISINISIDTVGGITVNEKSISDWFRNSNDCNIDYLIKANYYSTAIEFENDASKKIKSIENTFGFIGSFRNYGTMGLDFSIGIGAVMEDHQKNYRTGQYRKSTHSVENGEPSIFNYMRGVLSFAHSKLTNDSGVQSADIKIKENNYIKQINRYLKSIDLEIIIKKVDEHTPNYQFSFVKPGKNNSAFDFNILSAGQRSFLHIIFEVIGNNIKNGCIVIDEPELHLHNQLQQEYLNLINELSKSTTCQFIMVTHSDVFVNEKTIKNVARFALEKSNGSEYSKVFIPQNTINKEAELIKLLDNKRAGNIFFSKKVVLVEGETDRYFFQSLLDLKHPKLKQDITVMDISGKGNYKRWKPFLDSFGIQNYFIGDLDNVSDFDILTNSEYQEIIEKCKKGILKNIDKNCIKKDNCKDAVVLLSALDKIVNTKSISINKKEKSDLSCLFKYMLQSRLPCDALNKYLTSQETLKQKIEKEILAKYKENIFILKSGTLEAYTEKSKSLENTITFCNENLKSFLKNKKEKRASELNTIINQIIK